MQQSRGHNCCEAKNKHSSFYIVLFIVQGTGWKIGAFGKVALERKSQQVLIVSKPLKSNPAFEEVCRQSDEQTNKQRDKEIIKQTEHREQ